MFFLLMNKLLTITLIIIMSMLLLHALDIEECAM